MAHDHRAVAGDAAGDAAEVAAREVAQPEHAAPRGPAERLGAGGRVALAHDHRTVAGDAEAPLLRLPPARSPSPTMPPSEVQRNAVEPLLPTTTEPSLETSLALPGPSPSMPPLEVQRTAWEEENWPAAMTPLPTTTEPSPEAPRA